MKKILHSGQFLDYDGNTIKVTFYKEKHLWVSRTSIASGIDGGEYMIEVWSDLGDAEIYDSEYDWIEPISAGNYKNKDGHTVYRYNIQIASRPLFSAPRTGELGVGVEVTESTEGYDGERLRKTITISQ